VGNHRIGPTGPYSEGCGKFLRLQGAVAKIYLAHSEAGAGFGTPEATWIAFLLTRALHSHRIRLISFALAYSESTRFVNTGMFTVAE
jgi:hypothetical protein